ncbi:Gfo/Idh/MocA family protein [Paenibacillus crassostreae]|uniref:Dehydrogenase n=1 Tax=Paenibacillus crassostreae TaxID=1763538 RepID=A0A167API2_9BACL|nr:Gfo/Idh/MocA family oxidoreductase [Paenibacillus crassostreae]AOZ93744.1 dehydrogenase [Paenibacillus crassostreae]OAB71279.1 dehydrogenase [Paenibacillus crassostreae]
MVQANDRKIKWGILGTGWIAGQFAKDLVHAKNGEIYAVGSRSNENAQRFADQHHIPQVYGSYEALVNDPDVDAIYVATPHPFHKDNVLTCLQAGKAVLCEKPFTVNSNELEEIVSYAKEHKLFLMEGMWTRFLPPIIKVKEWLEAGRIGDVRQVKADFGFRMGWEPESRLLNPSLGGGALLDVGIYPISFASMIFGSQPKAISSVAHIGETGVDEEFTIVLSYESDQTAVLSGAIRLELNNEAYIRGTEGYIHIPSFFNAQTVSLHVGGEEVEKFTDDRQCEGYTFEAEEVGRCLLEGLTESPVMTLDESINIMKILDQVRGQWGLRYPFEG